MRPFFALEQVVHQYREERTGIPFDALRVARFAVSPGETVVVVGTNGCGKSTLLELCAGLKKPTRGRVIAAEKALWRDPRTTLAIRRKTPMLLQRTVLFSTSVLKNAMFGLHACGVRGRDARRRAEAALAAVGMLGLAHRRHDELSGGEQRRVALARVIALDPPSLILDEPTAGLDHESEVTVEALIAELGRAGRTILLATHDRRQAAALGTRVVTLAAGTIVEEEQS